MKIAFTICSNNYLAQAFTLGDSLLQSNPDYTFLIGLCDQRNEQVDYSTISKYPIVDVQQIGIDSLDDMASRYNIIELNTSVKPFFFKYLLNTYAHADRVLYIDPDIYVYDSFKLIDDAFDEFAFQLTPHILSPIPLDGKHPGENFFLKYGIYNLGFLGLKRTPEVMDFLNWWADRLVLFCYKRVKDGLFVDQKWIDFVPVYWKDVKIWDHPGMNMAYWNFHERSLTQRGDQYWVNQSSPLIFFHFSSIKANQPNIERSQGRVTFEDSPELHALYLSYCDKVLKNNYMHLKGTPCRLGLPLVPASRPGFLARVKTSIPFFK